MFPAILPGTEAEQVSTIRKLTSSPHLETQVIIHSSRNVRADLHDRCSNWTYNDSCRSIPNVERTSPILVLCPLLNLSPAQILLETLPRCVAINRRSSPCRCRINSLGTCKFLLFPHTLPTTPKRIPQKVHQPL